MVCITLPSMALQSLLKYVALLDYRCLVRIETLLRELLPQSGKFSRGTLVTEVVKCKSLASRRQVCILQELCFCVSSSAGTCSQNMCLGLQNRWSNQEGGWEMLPHSPETR